MQFLWYCLMLSIGTVQGMFMPIGVRSGWGRIEETFLVVFMEYL